MGTSELEVDLLDVAILALFVHFYLGFGLLKFLRLLFLLFSLS